VFQVDESRIKTKVEALKSNMTLRTLGISDNDLGKHSTDGLKEKNV